MNPSNEGSNVEMLPVAAVTTVSTVNSIVFCRDNFDYANILVKVGTGNTQTAVITGIAVAESDTVTSSVTSMTNVPSLCCSNTTSTAAINALPVAAVQGVGGTITEFQIDLRKRKRYIGVRIHTDTVQTALVWAEAYLTRAKEYLGTNLAAIAAQHSLPLNLANTAVVGCMQIVAG